MYTETKIIHFKHRNFNHTTQFETQFETMALSSQKILTKRGEPTSVLGMLIARGYLPRAYSKTISQYEILRNHSLADGPNRPKCVVMGKPKLARKYTHTYVRDVDIQKAERIYKIWRDSVHILQSYGCKDVLDSLLRMEGAANDQALLVLDEIHTLRCGLRALTRYYGKQMAA